MANESEPKPQANPLVRQVDTLRRSHDAETEVPVLTEVVERRESSSALDPLVLEALARQLERAVLDHFGPEFNRLVEERLASALSARLEQSVSELRAELVAGLDQMAREAVASAIANTFRARSPAAPRASESPDLSGPQKKAP